MDVLHYNSANVAMPSMDNALSMFETPKAVKSDNRSPFNGTRFTYMGSHYRKTIPLRPQTNATAERFVCATRKII